MALYKLDNSQVTSLSSHISKHSPRLDLRTRAS